MKRSLRIYEGIIKSESKELYRHLIVVNQMNPELQLVRWLKCMLAREFTEYYSLQCWDFILGGLYSTVTSLYQP